MKKYNTFLLLFAVILFCSCEKENPKQADSQNAANSSSSAFIKPDNTNNQTVPGGTASACTISGNFTGTAVGTSPANNGITVSLLYNFGDNNFFRVASPANNPYAGFGGYRVTCDSIIIVSYNTLNSGYYLVSAKFSNNRNSFAGTWVNQNNPSVDYGTLALNKQ